MPHRLPYMDFVVWYQTPDLNGAIALYSIIKVVTSKFYLKSRKEKMTRLASVGVEVLQFNRIHASYLPFFLVPLNKSIISDVLIICNTFI